MTGAIVILVLIAWFGALGLIAFNGRDLSSRGTVSLFGRVRNRSNSAEA